MKSTHDFELEKFKPTADIIKRYYNGRKIVFWGSSPLLQELLERDYGIKVDCIATSSQKAANDKILFLDNFKDKSDEYYIVAPHIKCQDNYKDRLKSLGYMEFTDFFFRLHERIELEPGVSEYHDLYGNHVHCKDAKVVIPEWVYNATVFVDDTTKFGENSRIKMSISNTEVRIAKNCTFCSNALISMNTCSKLIIDEGSTFGCDFEATLNNGNSIKIGKDCMISHQVKMYSGDGHAIFDLKTGQRTSLPFKSGIEIKDHVGVGLRATILYSTVIENSCIVGAGAVVKGKFPNNCAIGGVPAKILKKDITWHRNYLQMEMEDCGEENLHFTEEL